MSAFIEIVQEVVEGFAQYRTFLYTDAMSNCSYRQRLKKFFEFLLHICVFMSKSSSTGKLTPVQALCLSLQ